MAREMDGYGCRETVARFLYDHKKFHEERSPRYFCRQESGRQSHMCIRFEPSFQGGYVKPGSYFRSAVNLTPDMLQELSLEIWRIYALGIVPPQASSFSVEALLPNGEHWCFGGRQGLEFCGLPIVVGGPSACWPNLGYCVYNSDFSNHKELFAKSSTRFVVPTLVPNANPDKLDKVEVKFSADSLVHLMMRVFNSDPDKYQDRLMEAMAVA